MYLKCNWTYVDTWGSHSDRLYMWSRFDQSRWVYTGTGRRGGHTGSSGSRRCHSHIPPHRCWTPSSGRTGSSHRNPWSESWRVAKSQHFRSTVRSFYFMGTQLRGSTTMAMGVDKWICGFQNTLNIIHVNKYFIRILHSGNVLPTKYTKLNVQWIKMILQ